MAQAKQWNPMEDVCRESNAEIAKSDQNQFQLCLRNVPSRFSKKDVYPLCMNYGKVVTVHASEKTPYIFVNFATMSDMERALNGLRDNEYGIKAEISRITRTAINQNRTSISDSNKSNNSLSNGRRLELENTNGIDMAKRESNDDETSQKNFNFKTDSSSSADTNEQDGYSAAGECVLCMKFTTKTCQRCGDYYCSRLCQTRDWQRHRYICFPLPPLGAAKRIPIPSKQSVYVEQMSIKRSDNIMNAESIRKSNSIEKEAELLLKPDKQIHNYEKREGSISSSRTSLLSEKNDSTNMIQSDFFPKTGSTNLTKKSDNELSRVRLNSNVSTTSTTKFNNSVTAPVVAAATLDNTSKTMDNIKKAEKLLPNENSLIPKAEFPKNGSTVVITTVISAHQIYIRSNSNEDKNDYVNGINIIHVEGKQAKPLTTLPKKGDYAITDFDNSGYYRVIIMNVENAEKIHVTYIDFGNKDIKKLSDLREISAKALQVKQYTFPIYLKDVKLSQANDQIKKFIQDYVDVEDNELKLFYSQNEQEDNNIVHANLFDSKNCIKLNDKIMDLNNVNVTKVSIPCDEPVMEKEFPTHFFSNGTNISLFVTDNSLAKTGYISCIAEKNLLSLEKFNIQLRDYVKKIKGPYTPREHEICLVQFDLDDLWYRGVCVEIDNNGNPIISFVDYGNIETVHVSKIRKYPRDLIFPLTTHLCEIANLSGPLPDKAVFRLQQLVPMNSKITVNKVEVYEDECYTIVHLDDVVQILKKEGLI